MNPDAKEFVPAHILKRRQEEKEAEKTLDDVTDKLDKVDLKSDGQQENKGTSCRVNSTDKTNESSREVQDPTQESSDSSSNENVKPNSTDQHSSTSARLQNGHSNHNQGQQYNINNNNNNHFDGDYPEEAQDLYEEDDRFLLNPGENICEFNGEQFIVPGDDDEYEPPNDGVRAGYDFGNAEDNENEDVRQEFEKFLVNLPADQ